MAETRYGKWQRSHSTSSGLHHCRPRTSPYGYSADAIRHISGQSSLLGVFKIEGCRQTLLTVCKDENRTGEDLIVERSFVDSHPCFTQLFIKDCDSFGGVTLVQPAAFCNWQDFFLQQGNSHIQPWLPEDFFE